MMDEADGSEMGHAYQLMEAAQMWRKEGEDKETFLRAAGSFWDTSEALLKFMEEE